VDEDVVADTRVQRRDHERLAVHGEAEVRDERCIEHGVDRLAVVPAALGKATHARARGDGGEGWREAIGQAYGPGPAPSAGDGRHSLGGMSIRGRSMTSKGLIAILASAAVALVIALPASARSSTPVIAVTAGKPSELKFTLSRKSVANGKVTFKVTNKGALEHDFKIGGKVTPKIKPGKTVSLTVTLKKGKARYLCTVPGHAAAGMRGVLAVT
jgi:uncharacterized cupredoxin-like copper-binding protein